jgi:hypothetical protein
MMADLVRLAKRAFLAVMLAEGIPGVMGKGDGSTTYYTDPDGTTHRDKCWVRIGDPSNTTSVVARNTRIPAQYGLPVVVAVRRGVIEVIRADYQRAGEYTEHRLVEIPSHAWTHQRFGSDPLYVEGIQVMPLMTVPQNPADMTVYVEPGFYRYLGTEKAWTGGDSDDLSGYVPDAHALTGFINHHFVIICLDRASNALEVVDGDDDTTSNYQCPFTASDVAAISIDDDYYPLAAIHLYQGQTAIQVRHIFMDHRLWGGERIGSGQLPHPLVLDSSTTLEISGGSVTVTTDYHIITTESGPEDDLDTIVAANDRQILVIQAGDDDTITVKHNTGNIKLYFEADCVLHPGKTLMLFYDGSYWRDLEGQGGDYYGPPPLSTDVLKLQWLGW